MIYFLSFNFYLFLFICTFTDLLFIIIVWRISNSEIPYNFSFLKKKNSFLYIFFNSLKFLLLCKFEKIIPKNYLV